MLYQTKRYRLVVRDIILNDIKTINIGDWCGASLATKKQCKKGKWTIQIYFIHIELYYESCWIKTSAVIINHQVIVEGLKTPIVLLTI